MGPGALPFLRAALSEPSRRMVGRGGGLICRMPPSTIPTPLPNLASFGTVSDEKLTGIELEICCQRALEGTNAATHRHRLGFCCKLLEPCDVGTWEPVRGGGDGDFLVGMLSDADDGVGAVKEVALTVLDCRDSSATFSALVVIDTDAASH